ncbi:MAG: multidrug efflux SMR transporter [Methylophilaceae bacterium]|nr:multidrug efflux SMR transporter [Methylophilaceae bacterium]
MNWFYLSIAIIAEVVATSALKSANGFTEILPSIIVVVGYLLSFYLLSLTLSSIPVSVVYAIWSGVGMALITLIGWKFYGQALDTPAMIGLVLIVTGVVLLNGFSSSITT